MPNNRQIFSFVVFPAIVVVAMALWFAGMWNERFLKGVPAITGVLGFWLAFHTVVINRDLTFRNSLQAKQFDELTTVRALLHRIWKNIVYSKVFVDGAVSANSSLVELAQENSEEWQRLKQYQQDSDDLFYKVAHEDYFLFPKWLNVGEMRALGQQMRVFAPFTFSSLNKKKSDEIEAYQNVLLQKISYLDTVLRQRS